MMFAMRARLAGGAMLAAMLLVACATRPVAPTVLDATQQAQLLRAMSAFTLEGRVAVRAGEEGWQASVRWRQRDDISEVRLSGPFGAGALQLRFDGSELTLTTSRGQVLRGDEATQVLRQQLGFDPPIAELRHWLLADAGPDHPATQIETGANGRPAALSQQEWRLQFEDYRQQQLNRSAVQMPRRLIATRGDVRLRLVVDRWKLGRAR